jgi:hypothetical protein
MRFFRFQRAAGGHANDCDMLVAKLPIAQLSSKSVLFRQLGFAIPLDVDKDVDQMADHALKTYFSQKGWTSRLLSDGFSWRAFGGHILIERFGSGPALHEVTEDDVQLVEKLESQLAEAGLTFTVPPSSHFSCFSAENYTEYFRTTT